MRRRRRRTSYSYRLRKFLMDRMPVRRRRRFRVVDRRRFMIAQCLLVAVAVAALGLSASVIVRSIRTAKVNESLVALHTVEAGAAPAVEIAAPPMEAQETSRQDGGLTLTFMGMPDGSAIKTAAVATAPTVLHKTTGDILPDMLKLIRTNPDTVGWISINGIVHLPVVYRDNTYYLTHDFNGHHNTSGTLAGQSGRNHGGIQRRDRLYLPHQKVQRGHQRAERGKGRLSRPSGFKELARGISGGSFGASKAGGHLRTGIDRFGRPHPLLRLGHPRRRT